METRRTCRRHGNSGEHFSWPGRGGAVPAGHWCVARAQPGSHVAGRAPVTARASDWPATFAVGYAITHILLWVFGPPAARGAPGSGGVGGPLRLRWPAARRAALRGELPQAVPLHVPGVGQADRPEALRGEPLVDLVEMLADQPLLRVRGLAPVRLAGVFDRGVVGPVLRAGGGRGGWRRRGSVGIVSGRRRDAGRSRAQVSRPRPRCHPGSRRR
jgi:hypothetical protein